MKKTISMLILLCVLVGLMPVSVFAETGSSTLAVSACNVMFADSVYLEYAVPTAAGRNVKLNIWKGDNLGGEPTATLSSERTATVLGQECYVFVYRGMSAKCMSDNVYAQPEAAQTGKLHKYSVLEYAYKKLGKIGTGANSNAGLKALLSSMLTYGGNAQRYFNYNVDRPADSEFYQVQVVGGTLNDGFTKGMYLKGETVKLTAPAQDAVGTTFHHWETSDGKNVGTTAQLSIAAGAKNEVYTARYGAPQAQKPMPSVGLEITVEDEEAIVASLGSCTDEFVVLPDTYEGKPVRRIDTAAFTAESFTSIYIPRSVVEVGARAFNKSALSTVYYEGTENEWKGVTIGGSNAPLTSAEFVYESCGPAPTEKFTVTFKDDNGAVLKSEQVAKGESATPPADPIKDGSVFLGWQGSYTNIQSNVEITAKFEAISDPVIVVGSAAARAGGQVDVPVRLCNNPGIAAATIQISYDDSLLTLDSLEFGSKFNGGTEPPLQSPMTLVYDALKEVSGDVVYATLHFTVKKSAQSGVKVPVSVGETSVCDINENLVVFQSIDGVITVE